LCQVAVYKAAGVLSTSCVSVGANKLLMQKGLRTIDCQADVAQHTALVYCNMH